MIFQFADDFLICTFDKDFERAVIHMKNILNQFARKCQNLKLSFNLDKTKSIYLAKESRKSINLSINNKTIEQVKSIKFLGRNINMSLSVGEHYERVMKESSRNLNLLKCLRNCH